MLLRTQTKTRLASAAYHGIHFLRRLVGLGDRTVVTRRGLRWQLDLNEGIDLAIYLFGAFEPGTVSAYTRLISPGTTVLDVGANIGAHTLHFARLVGPNGRVVAFEPTAYAFDKLRANVALNPSLAQRIILEQVLLADGKSEALPERVYSSWPLDTRTDLHDQHCGRLMDTAACRVATLDQYIKAHQLTDVALIKIDVDGSDCAVLAGAVELLADQRPKMVVELAPYALEEAGHSLGELLHTLYEARYGLYALSSGHKLPIGAKAMGRLIPAGAGINVLAAPE